MKQIEAEQFAGFMRVLTPKEVKEHEMRVGYSNRRLDVAHDLLYEIFRERGYDLRYSSNREFPGSSKDPAELRELWRFEYPRYNVFCEDPVQRADLDTRIKVIARIPDFRFLANLHSPSANIGVLEKVVAGERLDGEVQQAIPGAQHMQLTQDNLREGLVSAYSYREEFLQRKINWYYKGRPEDDDHYDYRRELSELRRKKDELGSPSLSPEKLRMLLDVLVLRAERFIEGRT